MAEGIVYLDVDDEITSAASRIRTAPGTKVALVVPYGSRIATSRMNFRLLSREALVSNRRLSIVSGDAAARSLAASAGLPVFATVPEYEAAIARPSAEAGPGTGAGTGAGTGPAAGGAGAAGVAAGGLAASETVAAVGRAADEPAGHEPAGSGAAPERKSQRPKRPTPDPATAAPLAVDAGLGPPPSRSDWVSSDRTAPDSAAELDDAPTARAGGRRRGPLIAVLGLAALALVVLAAGAYLFLPSASIALTPRRDGIGPMELTVAADPKATGVDAANNVVPAIQLDVPVEAQRTFTTTGTKVKETVAGGSVTFTNYDPTASNTIPSGSIVSTEGGIRFRTLSTLVVPRASFTPPTTTVPSEASVDIQAVKPGTQGNVPANAIRVVPPGESSLFLAVHNPDQTTGGTHTETPEIKQPEVDKAVAALQLDLEAAFRENVASGAGAPAGVTLFPETAVLGTVTPDIDPKTLVGQPLATFDLKLSASGTVIAVDPTPIRTIAQADLQAQVTKGHRLVPDSVDIVVGDGTVGEDGQVTFLATARAVQVAIVDPEAVRSLVKGKTAAEAQAALVPFGTASVTLWPDWVSTVTGVDSRLTVIVNDGSAGGAGSAPSPGPSASPRRSGPVGSGASPRSAAPAASGSAGGASSAP